MDTLKYTLVADGTSDSALMPILERLMRSHALPYTALEAAFVDWFRLGKKPYKLHQRLAKAVEMSPCDLLFVHRDAEAADAEDRVREIESARILSKIEGALVCVVPIRMTEAWLLVDEPAIRYAADNPNGSMPLDMPRLSNIESLADPKEVLHSLLKKASGAKGRRLQKFDAYKSAIRVADCMDSIEPLRKLSAFEELESELKLAIAKLAKIRSNQAAII